MTRIDHILKSRSDSQPFYSFEYFPPKTEDGMANLALRLARMASLGPSWVSVTWGAGGSTADRSLELAATALEEGFNVCLHLTCTNMQVSKLDDALKRAKALGIHNILALRGDPPRGEEYSFESNSQFNYAIDLVRYIRNEYGDYFCIGVAAYPEAQPPPTTEQEQPGKDELEILVEKIDAGAHFVVTQLFYDTNVFLPWYTRCRERGVTVPILAGVLPIQSYNNFRRIVHLTQASVPKSLSESLEPIKADDQAIRNFGVEYATAMIKSLTEAGVNGFHICTLNLEQSIRRIINELGWTPKEEVSGGEVEKNEDLLQVPPNSLIARSDNHHAPHLVRERSREKAEFGDEIEIEATKASEKAMHTLPGFVNQSTRVSVGGGAWDEFPNGRFGDARSPAYGEIDGWGVSLKIVPQKALSLWGHPTCEQDISRMFCAYLEGKIECNPWSDEPILSETMDVLEHLIHLNRDKHWWTVGSQPAVDGVSSSDPTYGFGPANSGNVYQKSFVEFFAPEQVVLEIEHVLAKYPNLPITFYAGKKGESETKNDDAKYFKTNMPDDGANAVTWGVFIGKEIVTTTLIEEMSFKAWKDEAFEIWKEWQLLYPVKSPSRELLNKLANERWLVSIVHHDYKNPKALWEFLDFIKV